MLIDYGQFDTIQTGFVVGFLVLAGLSLILAIWKRRIVIGGLAVLCFLLSIGAILLPDSFTMTVFRVTETAGEIDIRRAVLLSNGHYRLANGTVASITSESGLTQLVINDTARPLVILPVVYSTSGAIFSPDKPVQTIPPYGVSRTNFWIRYLGRGARQPPATVMSTGPVETRYWLTWELQ